MKKVFFCFLFLFVSIVSAQNSNYVLAENYYRNNEYEKALQLYKKLADKSKYNTNYLQRLIRCYQETNQFDKATDYLNKRLKYNPKMVYCYALLGSNFERQKDTIQAQKYYRKSIESLNTYPNYGTNLASVYKGLSKLDYAIEAYQKTQEKNKGSNYDFQIAQLYGEQGKFAKMFESYIDHLDTNPKYLSKVKRYTARYVTDDSENANNILFKKALLRRSMSNPKNEWNSLLAWLFTKQKDYSKAFIQHKALYVRKPESLSGIKTLGDIAFSNKEYELAKQCFDFVIEKTEYPKEKFEAISKNLKIAIATKQPNIELQFSQIFKEFGENSNTLPIQLVYADYLTFDKNNPEQAKLVLEKALQFTRSRYLKADIKLKLGDVLVYQNKFNKALIYFSQIQTKFPNHVLGQQARFKVAQTSFFKHDFKWAKAQLKILKSSATQLTANDAIDLFLIISDNQPKDSVATGLKEFAKAKLFGFQNKTDQAIETLSSVLSKYKGQAIEDEALFVQATLFTKKEMFDKAITNYKAIISSHKEGILVDDSLYQLAQLYRSVQKPEKAKEYYEKIVFEHPGSIYLVDARKQFRKLRGDQLNN